MRAGFQRPACESTNVTEPCIEDRKHEDDDDDLISFTGPQVKVIIADITSKAKTVIDEKNLELLALVQQVQMQKDQLAALMGQLDSRQSDHAHQSSLAFQHRDYRMKRYCFRRNPSSCRDGPKLNPAGSAAHDETQCEPNVLRLSASSQEVLRSRLTKAIEETMSIDGHMYKKSTLQEQASSFFSICDVLPDVEFNSVGWKLRQSYYHAIGRNLGADSKLSAEEFDDILLAHNLAAHRDKAAKFILAVGQV
jgi:hypothetical protein